VHLLLLHKKQQLKTTAFSWLFVLIKVWKTMTHLK